MRVTNKMMADNTTAQLFKQVEQMARTQERIVSGKRINRPSDDPVGISSALAYRKTISSLDQYNENITKAKLHIDTAENVLEIVTGHLLEAKEIAFDTAPDMRAILARDVSSLREQILQMSNYQIDGKDLFSGDLTDTTPYDATGTYFGDDGSKQVMVGDNMQVDMEADGRNVFLTGANNVFTILNDLETALLADNAPAIESQISLLDNAIDNVKGVRTQIAGTYKRIEATENHYGRFKVNMQDLLSRTEDADIAEAIINFQVQQTTYESTLASSSMIIKKSLIDFLS